MPTKTDSPALGDLLPDGFTLGEPDCVGPLAVFRVHAAPGTCEYLSFAEASAHGCRVQELEPPTVGDVVIDNPLDLPVLCSRARRSGAPSRTARSTSRSSCRRGRG
jgi:hypothetical protein